MKLVFAPLAESDLAHIWDFLALERANRVAADKQIRRLFTVCESLRSYPFVGPERRDLAEGLRYVPVDQYVVFYRVLEEWIEIARIIHAKRDVAAFFE